MSDDHLLPITYAINVRGDVSGDVSANFAFQAAFEHVQEGGFGSVSVSVVKSGRGSAREDVDDRGGVDDLTVGASCSRGTQLL